MELFAFGTLSVIDHGMESLIWFLNVGDVVLVVERYGAFVCCFENGPPLDGNHPL